MRIYNFKVNKTKLTKILLLVFIFICLIILFLSLFNLFTKVKNYKNENFVVNDSFSISSNKEIPSNQYTNVLKAVHDNLDNYIGKEITFTGYIYKIDYLEKINLLSQET